jgi:transmembrane sensor
MKEMKDKVRFSDSELEEIASVISGEKTGRPELMERFLASDGDDIVNEWSGLRNMTGNNEIDVDRAWAKVTSRIENEANDSPKGKIRILPSWSPLMKIAAAALILVTVGTAALLLTTGQGRNITIATTSEQANFRVSLPDGSNIFLNRESRLTYRSSFGKHSRNVALAGEAFFEIASNASKPFIIDAGKARIKVVGTSFNVITSNPDSAVEVFVRTGKVMLSNNSGSCSMLLEPGFIGTMDSKISDRKLNSNPNYLGWHNRRLEYQSQSLSVVFADLKRVYNLDIVADDPDILNEIWTSPIDNTSEDIIIQLICGSYNLGYTKVGNVYHLVRK